MKNIVRTFVACFALVLGLSGCYDEIDDKASIDAKYEQSSKATITLSETSAISFSEVSANASLSDVEGVLEVGFMFSTASDFQTYSSYPASEVSASFSKVVSGLSEQTTYYVRSYAYTVSGTVVSEPVSVTTPVSPTFDLGGVYTAVDYDAEDGSAGDPYEVTVKFVEGSTTAIQITNIWDGGMTVDATYDPATGKVTIPAEQVIYVHPSYGDVWMADGDDAPVILGQFTAKGGFFNINTFYAVCGAGSFGAQYVKMNHQ